MLSRTLLFVWGSAALAASGGDLERRYARDVQPFVAKYCIACHSGDKAAAQFNLKQYTTVAMVAKDHARWALLVEKLESRQMPPKGLPQPPDPARARVVAWVKAMRDGEAHRNAGDPGIVLAHRLSNAEYNYTIRDLTDVDIRPAREFPVDPANPEGFDNSGESLAMSPALLAKYLQAAREVADHMVLKPHGFDFAPHPMLVETDREKYTIKRIVDFYDRQPTDYADYFYAAWGHKNGVLTNTKVSPKYLRMIWQALNTPEDVGPMAKLQAMWKALPYHAQAAREGCVAMRDFVLRIRKHTARQFSSPMVKGLSATSQPLMNWKLRAFASHRRDFDRSALREEGDPPPVIPVVTPGRGMGEDQTAIKAAALAIKERMDDPDLVIPKGQRERYEAAFARFASVFPDAFYIRERGRFYPDDREDKGRLLSAGFHNVMGYFRDDTPLCELLLSEKQKKELDELWDEFDMIADFTTRTYIQYYFNQSGEVRGMGRESGTFRPSDKEVTSEAVIFGLRDEYLAKAKATHSSDVAVQAIKDHFPRVNETIRRVEQMRIDAEPHHLEALVRFAERAYRRPLTPQERDDILTYYHSLREDNGLAHDEAMRDSVVSVLMSPDFCYRVNTGDPGYALANRLSYFLWSSMPDEQLLAHARDLHRPDVIVSQARRMLRDGRARALAVEFAGHWLDFRRFEDYNSADRGRFPSFTNELRQAMFEEPVRLVDDAIRGSRSMLDVLYGNYTFVNAVLARHYGMDLQVKEGEWVRVDDARRYGRGGLLPMAVFLTQNSPGLRTSPVKRGYWMVRRLLGEVVPPPPPTVPQLPDDEAKLDLPLRDVLARHRKDPSCAACHSRFDSFGLAFEGYGPVGERRTQDLAGRTVDENADFPGGMHGEGYEGVLAYIRERRQDEFIDNLCRKLTAYALGRSLLLSDEPAILHMKTKFAADGYRFTSLVESIVTSSQFQNHKRRGHHAN